MNARIRSSSVGSRDLRPGAGGRTKGQYLVIATVTVAAAFFLVFGGWAFLWPHNFYEVVAEFPPYNLHLFHDAGAFQLGIGASLLGALFWSDAVFVALLGGSTGSTVHAISHVIDRDLGGNAGGTWSLIALAVLLILMTGLRLRRMPLDREEH